MLYFAVLNGFNKNYRLKNISDPSAGVLGHGGGEGPDAHHGPPPDHRSARAAHHPGEEAGGGGARRGPAPSAGA